MRLRHLFSWKPLFYERLLPVLRLLGPAPASAFIGAFGRLLTACWPPRQWELQRAIRDAQKALRADWHLPSTQRELAANALRFLARDCLLEGAQDDEVFARFDVHGFEHVECFLREGRGFVLLGNHLGAYLAAVHWLYRRGVPVRLLVQRPRHVSRNLQSQFDCNDGPHPQTSLLLRRDLAPGVAAERMIRARAALRDGCAIYLAGDVPWTGPNARPGRLLGHEHTFLAIWTDLAILARAPVVPLFCTLQAGGRYRLVFDPPWDLEPGAENAAVVRYLARLEAEIAAHPADAVAHLLWPCYRSQPARPRKRRRSRRKPDLPLAQT